MAKRFYVQCTLIYNGGIYVEAEDEYDALEIARDKFDSDNDENDLPRSGYIGEVEFDFGEVTADDAGEVKD